MTAFISPAGELDSAPVLYGSFAVEAGHGAVRRAELAYTALGVVEATLDGEPVSDALLTPGWSAYEWRLRISRADVRGLLADPGERQELALHLADGWYRGRLGWNRRRALYGDRLAGWAELEIEFDDGHVQRIETSRDWQAGPGAVLAADLYDGQTIDARRGEAWRRSAPRGPVEELDIDPGRLVERLAPPVVRLEERRPLRIWTSPSGRTLVDFGQNLVGWVRARVRGPEGSEIVIRHAEVLERDELATRPLRTAEATDRFILSGGDDVFEPTFTFHGFRFAEIDGWPGELRPEQLTAVVVGSALTRTGTFRCSDGLLNRLHENVVWSMRGNFVDVPTDCPQRDERLGWTGDLAVFAPTAAYLCDTSAFLGDWMRDLAAEQAARDGVVPFTVPDAIKLFGAPGDLGHGTPTPTAVWADAAVWVPWTLWLAYGDRTALAEHFDAAAAHVRAVEAVLSPSGLWDTGFQFGDWLDPDAPGHDPANGKADRSVVATACAFRSASLASAMARELGRSAEAAEFEALAARVREAFVASYVDDATGRIRSDCATVYALALAFGVLPEALREAAGDRLAELVAAAGHRISTGFAGTPFVLDALTATGHLDTAYRLLLTREAPSWLHPVTMGATTIWERWDSMLPDGTVNPDGMTSFNHYALGAVADWMHRTIAGISPLAPGCERILFAPRPGGSLTWASASLATPRGRAAITWRLRGDELEVDVEVPEGATALLRLPGGAEQELGPGRVSVVEAALVR